jgi:hypothetical protein
MKERRISTSWTLTYFWVLLSLILATLSTFSFVQVDWLVKRETLIVTHYLPSVNRSSTDTQVGRRTTSDHIQMNRNLHFPQTWPQFSSTLNYINNNNIEKRLNMTVIKIVKKTVTAFSWGVFGMCTNYEGSSGSSLLHCGLYKEQDIPRYTLRVVSTDFYISYEMNFHAFLLILLMYNFSWTQVLALLGGLGCLTLGASAIMSLMAVALPTSKLRYEVARTIGHAQAVSG